MYIRFVPSLCTINLRALIFESLFHNKICIIMIEPPKQMNRELGRKVPLKWRTTRNVQPDSRGIIHWGIGAEAGD